jgi:Ca2+-binding EF-hand superfamily protein
MNRLCGGSIVKKSFTLAAVALSSLAALVSVPVVAQEGAAESPFDALDRDHDGTLNAREGQGHPVVSQNFATADRDGNGSLSREEFNSAFTAARPQPSPATPSLPGESESPPPR